MNLDIFVLTWQIGYCQVVKRRIQTLGSDHVLAVEHTIYYYAVEAIKPINTAQELLQSLPSLSTENYFGSSSVFRITPWQMLSSTRLLYNWFFLMGCNISSNKLSHWIILAS